MGVKYELVAFEKVITWTGLMGNCNVLVPTFIETNESSTAPPITATIFRQALVLLQKRHPFLGAYLEVDKNLNKMYFVMLDEQLAEQKIDMETVDLTLNDYSRQTIVDECAKFNSRMFDYNSENLMWKAQLITYKQNDRLKYVVNLLFLMPVTDGFNSTTLSIETVNILNALLKGGESEEMKVRLEPRESVYHYCKTSKFIKDREPQDKNPMAAAAESEEKYKDRVTYYFPESFRNKADSGFQMALSAYDADKTDRIMKCCKAHGAKVNAYFYAATFYALKRLYDECGQPFPDKVVYEYPASMRIRYVPNLEYEHCRTHIALTEFWTDTKLFGDLKNFWQCCELVEEKSKKATNIDDGSLLAITCSTDDMELLSGAFGNASREESTEIIGHFHDTDVSLSNLGAYVNNNAKLYPGPYEIKEIYCSDSLQHTPAITPSIIMHLIYWKGKFMMQFGANRSLFADVYFNKYVSIFNNLLDEILTV